MWTWKDLKNKTNQYDLHKNTLILQVKYKYSKSAGTQNEVCSDIICTIVLNFSWDDACQIKLSSLPKVL